MLTFIGSFIVLTAILTGGNLFTKLPLVSSLKAFITIFCAMMPMMALYGFPLATSVAVHVVVGNLMAEEELILLRFLRSAQGALYKAVLFFSLILTLCYAPIVFFIAPHSYFVGKKLLLKVAKKHLYELEPHRFHSPYPGFTVYFQDKIMKDGKPSFSKLFLCCIPQSQEYYLFTADRGWLEKEKLFLSDGSVYNSSAEKQYAASFKETEIDVNNLFNLGKQELEQKQLKFLTLNHLLDLKEKDSHIWMEFYRRINQVAWQFFIPFFALLSILIFGRKKSNLLTAVVMSGLFLLMLYLSMVLGQLSEKSLFISFILLYIPLVLLAGILLFLYKQRYH